MCKKFFFDFKISFFIKNEYRRSLFNNAERGKFLNQLVAGVRKILLNPQVTKIQWLPENTVVARKYSGCQKIQWLPEKKENLYLIMI